MKSKDFSLSDVSFLPVTRDHIEYIARIEAEAFGVDAWSESMLEGELDYENKHYFAAILADEVIGYGGYAQIFDEAHIMNIAVKSDYRKNGIGEKILDNILCDAERKNIKAVTLEVNENNIQAIALYEKRGFKCAGVRKRYYHNTDGAKIYWKEL